MLNVAAPTQQIYTQHNNKNVKLNKSNVMPSVAKLSVILFYVVAPCKDIRDHKILIGRISYRVTIYTKLEMLYFDNNSSLLGPFTKLHRK